MIKQLLAAAAVATLGFNVSAETNVLWSTDVPEGVLATWATPLYSMNAEQAAAIKPGDILTMTVFSASTEGWPQVAIFDPQVGWPPLANTGVGGQTYPYVASIPVTNDIAETIHANGIDFKGDGANVTEIAQIKGPGYLDPNTVWFGHETLAWGKAISVPNTVFENVKAGDKIEVKYDTEASEHTLQILLGGWSGLNLATYEAGSHDFMSIDETTGTITVELTEALSDYEWDGKHYDVFTLLKEGGVVMQGPCTVNAVLYVPYTEAALNFYAVGGFQDWNPEEPAVFTCDNGIYTLVAEKASTMKISTAYGDWDTFNASTIGLSVAEVEFEDGSVPYTLAPDYEFYLDYEATWTVTINPANESIKFTTSDPRPQTEIYLRGSMNDWGTDEAWKFTTTDGELYTLSGVTIQEGDYFKVADAGWGAINYGAADGETVVKLGETIGLVNPGVNLHASETMENVIVEFNLVNKTLNITKTTAIGTISAESGEAEYYNIQGMRVTNPTEGGLYIVKKGTKVSKAIF